MSWDHHQYKTRNKTSMETDLSCLSIANHFGFLLFSLQKTSQSSMYLKIKVNTWININRYYANIPCDCQYTRIFSRGTLNCLDVLYYSTAEANITHPCNWRYIGKMFLYIDHSHIEYLLYFNSRYLGKIFLYIDNHMEYLHNIIKLKFDNLFHCPCPINHWQFNLHLSFHQQFLL
jgi:hypothetical protein